MDPSKAPSKAPPKAPPYDPPLSIENSQNNAMNESPYDIADSLNRMSLANATVTPLPTSPSLLSPGASSHPTPVSQPTPRRTPSSSSLREERRKSIPVLQKRQSTASLRSSSGHNGPVSPLTDSSRRSSANNAGSPTSAALPAMLPRLTFGAPEPEVPTAASIAAEHFQKEVDLHQEGTLGSKTIVVVHDACYGHRFSRPRPTRLELGSIVERPERIRACMLGVAAAYVRLGRRYSGEKFAPRPNLNIPDLPPPFQIIKSSRSLPLIDDAVTSVHGAPWMTELKGMCDLAESRLALTGKELVRSRIQDNDGLASSGPELHTGDLYLCAESQNAFQGALGAVCDGVDLVLGPGPTTRAFVCIRPPGHHCSADFPSGFCWINNVHVGISHAATQHGLTHAAIIDFDLHHGDGSQDITWNHNRKVLEASRKSSAYEKTPIGYYSLHDINSYPCEDGIPEKVGNASIQIDGAHGQSVWNVHMDTWATEPDFWDLYHRKYMTLIEKARTFLRRHTEKLAEIPNGPRPKAAIFISAGFDASEWEGQGMQRHRVNVPTDFYAKFTADVVWMSQEEGLGVDGRVISVLEGGYSDRALASGVLSHLSGLGSTPENAPPLPSSTPIPNEYDVGWWSPYHLEELEALAYPPDKSHEKSTPTFLNPTRSFSAKVVNPARERRTFGSLPGLDPSLPSLPEVGWATAAHELFKTLIPEHRQTGSYKPEDLNAAASRQRYERQIALDGGATNPAIVPLPPPTPVDDRRQLRVRRTKSPTVHSPRPATPRQQAMRSKSRRKTADGNDLPDASRESSPSVDASRRKSVTAVAPVASSSGTRASDHQRVSAGDGPSETSSRPTSTSGARKTSGSRSGTPKRTASPRKAPPVPKVPTTFLPSKLSDQVTLPKDDVENLSAGLQRIKLVMPSPEEQAAREKRANEERRRSARGGRTPKSPTSRKPAPGAINTKTGIRPEILPTNSPPDLPTPPIGVSASDAAVKKENQSSFPIDFSSETLASTLPMSANSSGPSGMGIMFPASAPSETVSRSMSPSISQQPALFTTSNSPPHTPGSHMHMDMSPRQANVFSPPTSEGQTKTGLPVFTSSSAIPFAAPEKHGDGHSQT
ncbi:hypothetical protein N7520_001559 [Penicillium odoratum]|uniref:uncharacterized protein n=1 Tax=Penicillium odoratum TaxID=1167516 RepID=UPI0025495AF0|nr:uncharacterized protein N7520_001559 [Penicillium odoratum]KAJ5778313.1 hypothetical protein N7520_001559 [Penicillium odoratum]